MRVGIDFGTTRTVVAACDRGNFPVVSFSAGEDPLDWFPTIAAARQDELRFGLDALAVAGDPEWSHLRSFKRVLSDPRSSSDAVVELGEHRIPVGELVTRFLESLKTHLLKHSNLPIPRRKKKEPLSAIVAVPANAHSTQRFITLDAFRKAGFEVVAMLNEPSAAGVEYAHRYRNTITSRRENVVVYDLGGGTFDASLVHMRDRAHDVLATAGVSALGGDDFDRVLLDMALAKVDMTVDDLSSRERHEALEHCRDQKERLHPNTKRVLVELGELIDTLPDAECISISTKDYYEACTPYVEKTIEVMERVVPDLDDVAGIYVVGGASALPVVSRALREKYGRRVHRSAYPSAATAIGLAIGFDQDSEYELTERFSRHFGVFREADSGNEVAFDTLIASDTELPEPGQGSVDLVRTYRPVHNVGHFRYIECGWTDAGVPSGDITPYAEVRFPFDRSLRRDGVDLDEVPITRNEPDAGLIEERYSIDSAGIVELTIRDLENGFETHHRLSR